MSNLVSTIITAQLKITIKCLSTTYMYYIRCIRKIYYKSSCFWMCKLCKKSDDTEVSKYTGTMELFPFSHLYSKGDLGGDLAIWEIIQTYTCSKTRRIYCLHDASEGGGSLTEEASSDITYLTLILLKSTCAYWALSLGSYRLATKCLPTAKHRYVIIRTS